MHFGSRPTSVSSSLMGPKAKRMPGRPRKPLASSTLALDSPRRTPLPIRTPPQPPPPPTTAPRRTFQDICADAKVQDSFNRLLVQKKVPSRATWQPRGAARLASSTPINWLHAIWYTGDDDLWKEALKSVENFSWEPPPLPQTVREGWTKHREFYWAWLRAPGVLRPSQSHHQRHMFMFEGRPYTVLAVLQPKYDPNEYVIYFLPLKTFPCPRARRLSSSQKGDGWKLAWQEQPLCA